MANVATKKDKEALAQALNIFVEHMHLSADVLESLVTKLEGPIDPADNRRRQDTVMEFGVLPPLTEQAEEGGSDFNLYLEGSQMALENSSTPIELEQP